MHIKELNFLLFEELNCACFKVMNKHQYISWLCRRVPKKEFKIIFINLCNISLHTATFEGINLYTKFN